MSMLLAGVGGTCSPYDFSNPKLDLSLTQFLEFRLIPFEWCSLHRGSTMWKAKPIPQEKIIRYFGNTITSYLGFINISFSVDKHLIF